MDGSNYLDGAKFYIKDISDDKYHELKKIEGLPESLDSQPFEGTAECEILSTDIFRLMAKWISRKRFIKLLMSRGIQRNETKEIANRIFNKYGRYTTYDIYLHDYFNFWF